MKKIISFVVGLLLAWPLSASHFTKNDITGMYDYAGDSIAKISVDFTTWTTDSLSDEAVGTNYTSGPHTLSFVERGGMGFQRCVIYPNRWLGSGLPNKNALFNNSNPHDADSLDCMAIYFPPVKGGVKSIAVTGTQGGRPLYVLGYSESAAAWQLLGTLAIAKAYDVYTYTVNSADICRIALYSNKENTAYTSITNIEVASMNEEEEEQPVDDALYVFNPLNNTYIYNGEPVEDISIDFANWSPSDLPSTLADDMPLTEVQDYGFVKWKIAANFAVAGNNQNVLFNNNASDFGGSPTNNTTTNPPAIYFPTMVRGVDSIAIRYVSGNSAFWMSFGVKDDNGSTVQSYQLPASPATDPPTYVLHLNSQGPTTVYIQYKMTVWLRIANIDFTLVEESTDPTGINQITNDQSPVSNKVLRNGQLVIIRSGEEYNAQGQLVK